MKLATVGRETSARERILQWKTSKPASGQKRYHWFLKEYNAINDDL